MQCSLISSGQFCQPGIVLCFLSRKEMCFDIVIRKMVKRSIQRDEDAYQHLPGLHSVVMN